MRSSKFLLLSLAIASPLYAQDVKVVGTLDQQIKAPKSLATASQKNTQHIKLLKMQLNQPAIKAIKDRAKTINQQGTNFTAQTSHLPNQVNLGMNNVPVLNQGSYGTCVTFATTAALDAAMDEGDYISQLCQLQLGNYLEANAYQYSGWDGSLGQTVLNQIETFGVVNKEQQQTVGCGGLTDYPKNDDPIPTSSIGVKQFHQISENLAYRGISWSPILDLYTATNRVDTNKTLSSIKQALNEKDRVVFAVLLLDFDLGLVGAVGSHNAQFDSWVLTPEIARDIYLKPDFGGHEMIITGYDDNAIAVDDQGRRHKGLLTLRNSWGDKIGDKGNFYMSYDYFKVLVIEAQRIRSMPADGEYASATA